MSKWMKVDPATLKVGDEVRMVDAFSMFQISGEACPSKIGICVGGIDFTEAPECRTWFVRKPKKPKDTARLQDSAVTERLQRPAEPPVGTFFRVERTGVEYVRVEKYGLRQYFLVAGLGHWAWDEITIPGDTITRLLLVEATDD